MTGFHADPAALDALARRLEDTAEEYGAAAASLPSPDEVGPGPVAAALTALTGEWSGRIRAVERDFTAAAADVRTAAKAYRATDAAAAEELGRADG
ncbi:Excreted virulence factor EspC, type VII ESX diderm [Amycolatopsis pretoriensis]|uniref:Excreted virulence factor EspC, type VII ESX diderm n=1 Tax=Amycolatopsis pretoriensis TaxID=218821 RepID=A0A1H5Q447_9PSEU|nr:type VII secretion target [Amycolatopsis pretoriensis]SEF20890.1 Excreted virulence factor EspC, type VII ESX diderm [Amycolatopsis pretoriensis]